MKCFLSALLYAVAIAAAQGRTLHQAAATEDRYAPAPAASKAAGNWSFTSSIEATKITNVTIMTGFLDTLGEWGSTDDPLPAGCTCSTMLSMHVQSVGHQLAALWCCRQLAAACFAQTSCLTPQQWTYGFIESARTACHAVHLPCANPQQTHREAPSPALQVLWQVSVLRK